MGQGSEAYQVMGSVRLAIRIQQRKQLSEWMGGVGTMELAWS